MLFFINTRSRVAGAGGGPHAGSFALRIAALTAVALGINCAGQNHLALTDTQRQNFSNLRQHHRQTTAVSLQELHTKERSLREQLRSGNSDAATLGRMLIDIETSRKQVEASRKSLREQMVSSLSADQKARLKVLEEARSLASAIHEAERLGLLEAPEPPPLLDGPGRFARGPRPAGSPGFMPNRRVDQ